MAESHGNAKAGAHTEADGGHHGGGTFPPFDSSTFASQLVSLLVFFVALYIIVSRVALPRVAAVIDARQNKIEGDLAEAQKLKDESESALKAYEGDLAAARSKAQAIGAETPREGERGLRGGTQVAGRQARGQARRRGEVDRRHPRHRDGQCARHCG